MKMALHCAAWFAVGFMCCFLWNQGAKLRASEDARLVLRAALAECTGSKLECAKTNKKWEELVQQWGSEQGKCDAILNFNKTIDVLEKETRAQKR
jgi:hypothetical protein